MLQVYSPLKLKLLSFPVNHIFQLSCDAVIGKHSTVRGDTLLYGHVPYSFPPCGMGSGHMRLCMWGQIPVAAISTVLVGVTTPAHGSYPGVIYSPCFIRFALSLHPYLLLPSLLPPPSVPGQ